MEYELRPIYEELDLTVASFFDSFFNPCSAAFVGAADICVWYFTVWVSAQGQGKFQVDWSCPSAKSINPSMPIPVSSVPAN